MKSQRSKATNDATAAINTARGTAEAQKLVQQTLTPQLLTKQAIDKWDGKFPEYMAGGGNASLLNLVLHGTKQAAADQQ